MLMLGAGKCLEGESLSGAAQTLAAHGGAGESELLLLLLLRHGDAAARVAR